VSIQSVAFVRVLFIDMISGKYYAESVADKLNVYVNVALVEYSSRGKTTELGGNPIQVPHCLPQILFDWLGIKPGPTR